MENSCMSVFPNTRTWEQQEWNKIKKLTKKVRREMWVWKEAKRAQKKKKTKYNNNNKHNLLVFYKRWKKHNETQLTK